ncbi:MAG: hypothetical protein HC906_09740 [Bacteroidales bacterium]|nr:hypothetical protein [Bacteroidales bacterium]
MQNLIVLLHPIEIADRIIAFAKYMAEKIGSRLHFVYVADTQQMGWDTSIDRNLLYPGQMTFDEYIVFEVQRRKLDLEEKLKTKMKIRIICFLLKPETLRKS